MRSESLWPGSHPVPGEFVPVIDPARPRNVPLRRPALQDAAPRAPHREPVDLGGDAVLTEPGRPFAHAPIPGRGIVAPVSVSPRVAACRGQTFWSRAPRAAQAAISPSAIVSVTRQRSVRRRM